MKRLAIIVFAAAAAAGTCLFSEDVQLRTMTVGGFPHRVATKYTAAEGLGGEDVRAAAVCGGRVFAGTDAGLSVYEGGEWKGYAGEGAGSIGAVSAVFCDGEDLVVGASGGALFFRGFPGALVRSVETTAPAISIGVMGGFTLIGTGGGLYVVGNGTEKVSEAAALKGREVRSVAVDEGGGAAWLATDGGLYRFDGVNAARYPAGGAAGPVSDDTRAVFFGEDGILWIGTDRGLTRHDPARGAWEHVTGARGGLPYEDVLAVAVGGGAVWVGTFVGAARWDGAEWHYFQGGRYLPGDRVQAAAVEPGGAAWLGVKGGLSKIEYRLLTLEET
ncbi:MAG: hypothetical protein AB1742_15105, partial [bacterium]